MPIEWKPSAAKHGIPQDDVIYAMTHATGTEEVDGAKPGQTNTVYVGHPHSQTDRYIEVIVATWPPNNLAIFHAMPLTDLYRHLT
jgi:hypothetical protein